MQDPATTQSEQILENTDSTPEQSENPDDSAKALVDDLTEAFNDFEQQFKPEETTETTETTKQTEQTETTEENADKTKEPVKEPVFDIKTVTVKHNGNDVPLDEVIEELSKNNPELLNELKADLRQRFDYTKKTQSLSEERKQFEALKSKAEDTYKYVYLENLANEVGGKEIPFEQFFNQLNESGEYKYSDDQRETAQRDYNAYLDGRKTKVKELEENRLKAAEINAQNIQKFQDKYGVTVDEPFLVELSKYVNPSITKNQMPFPDDTLEVFYKGKNFERLMEAERQKEREKVFKEIEENKNKRVAPEPVRTVKRPVIKQDKDEMDMAFDTYLNR